ncbi:MAG: FAD-binding oxidoreductase [Hyphomicrobiales bacterium]|nr:FAD-binding oxidoreductase [Hyphomicrobiales bacterium]
MATVAIVGGGIIGCAAAAWLLADGHRVTVFERSPEDRPASAGNLGLIATPEIMPLARPGTLAALPRWLLKPTGPASVRPRDIGRLAPFIARFVTASKPTQVRRATIAMARLMYPAIQDHAELARRAGLSGHMRHSGALHLFDGTAVHRKARAEWAERHRLGIAVEDLSPEDARDLVPAITGPFTHALLAPDYWMVSSPAAVLDALRRRVLQTGAIARRDVIALVRDQREVAVITAEGADLPFDRVVIAAGVWSRHLVRDLGLKLQLEAQRGYTLSFTHNPLELDMPVFAAQFGLAAVPLAEGLRIGGGVEFAEINAPINPRRAKALGAAAQRLFAALPESGAEVWMGPRPATPDSLPVIGHDPADPRIVFAFGHGHLGLTLAATTARHVAALITGLGDPSLGPFGIDRFQ